MLSVKNTLVAGAIAFAVGYIAGYATRDDQAEIERLNVAKYALEQERANLIQQLEVEHEHQKTAQINAANVMSKWMVSNSKSKAHVNIHYLKLKEKLLKVLMVLPATKKQGSLLF